MTDGPLMDADCIHEVPWYDCEECMRMTAKDEKYVVLKRSDWDSFVAFVMEPAADGINLNQLSDRILDDAVVIRTQDSFAGPALHGYAANIALGATIVAEAGDLTRAAELRRISDYFHARALEADAQGILRLPDL